MKELDEIYKHDLNKVIASDGIDGAVNYMKKEIRFTQITWIVICFAAVLLTICFSSCSEITPDEVIDDRLPNEYNYTPTYAPFRN